ncbi:cell wall-binding repeat-containing protein [Peptacetobacter sp.]|uniref:cell wall-binding repeat-containing protein n=1 Tax=Peptacetobacter sp. TaxID=2991975 RepID=UPI003AB2F77C
MKKSNKLISTVVVSTVLASSCIAVMANNSDGNSQDSQSSDGFAGKTLKLNSEGNILKFSLQNAGSTKGFYFVLKIKNEEGKATFKESSFSLSSKAKAADTKTIVSVEDNGTTIKIAATSDSDIVEKGTLNIGSIKVFGGKDAKYTIAGVDLDVVGLGGNTTEKLSDTEKSDVVGKEIENGTVTDGDGSDGNNSGGSGNTEGNDSGNNNTGGDNSENNGNSGGGSTGGGSSKPEEEKPLENNVQLFSMSGKDRYETSTKISKTGWTSGAKNVVIVNGNEKNMVDGLSATPFATIKDAPVLLSNGKTLPASTISELKRLNPTNVYVIGGTASMPESVVSSIKSNTKATVTRIGGSTRYETSLAIAKQIDKIADVSKVYISSGTGEVDALSIASVAGREKAPILLTNVNSIDNKTYDFIRSESIKDAYFIGGDKKISNSVINQVDKVVSADVSKNRVAGRNRKDTNAAIIKKFYTGSKLNGVVVSKDDVIIDALTVGSFAAKNDMPVVIGKDSLSTAQKNVLSSKNTDKVYQAGGGVKTSVINNLKELLGTKK